MDLKKKICFCIPARFKSTRLNEKLLLKFNDVSCLQLTLIQVLKSKYANHSNVFVFTDSDLLKQEVDNLNKGIHVIMTEGNYSNGSERISKNLDYIPMDFEFVVNVQADEPFISEKNIDKAIDKHLENYKSNENIFYTTLHELNNSKEYLESTASLKLVTDSRNNILYYSRNIIPWNKKNTIIENYDYKTFTGIYVYNRNTIKIYGELKNTELQTIEDCEQLKIIENGYLIKSYPTIETNEISLNTKDDYLYLLKKYSIDS